MVKFFFFLFDYFLIFFFVFFIDHDTQGTQNWKGDMTGTLLHWDTGLGWRDGPYPRTACYDILCGTKQWKGIEHHDPNPPTVFIIILIKFIIFLIFSKIV